MRVGIYGGSFNPPHVGHAMVIAWLRWTDQFDEVWLVPTFSHAFGKALTSYDERVNMCEALVQTLGSSVQVSRIEQELPPPSYTIHTLRELARRHPTYRFRLVLGADNLAVIDQWHAWDAIEQEFCPLVVGRVGYPSPEDTVLFPGVSSTVVRQRLADGKSVDHLVPAAVRSFLDLYRSVDS